MKSFKAFLIENTDIREEYKKAIKEFFMDKEGKDLFEQISRDYRNQAKGKLRTFADNMAMPGTSFNGKLNKLAEIIEKDPSKEFNQYNTINGLVVFTDVLRTMGTLSNSSLETLLTKGKMWDLDKDKEEKELPNEKQSYRKLFIELDKDGKIIGSITPWAGNGNYDKVIWSLDKQIALSEAKEEVKLEQLLPRGEHLVQLK